MKRRASRFPIVEAACWSVGAILILFVCAALAAGEAGRRQGVADFMEAARRDALAAQPAAQGLRAEHAREPVSPRQRETAAAGAGRLPVALLRIPSVGLEVPVFAGTSERELNRGAGWIAGTAAPDAGGNFAIAAHRDRHFRVLERVAPGTVMELQSRARVQRYRVTRTFVVAPDDVSALQPTTGAALTLVTCYPFRFVGAAPLRYIVRATAMN